MYRGQKLETGGKISGSLWSFLPSRPALVCAAGQELRLGLDPVLLLAALGMAFLFPNEIGANGDFFLPRMREAIRLQ